ncbi:endonuclease/exonuclease/phosphatase family protein [Sulfurimonas sp. HSL1-2]|uniref:endonuclease/exonuclease/phosphatase family protein n=1 Tax=Thiomicrolovo zhangzhouensis TaxID=3131933 RepID=UPI0031F9AB14
MRHYRSEAAGSPLPYTFSLLSWNVHKEMGRSPFDKTLQSLLATGSPELILFQEAVLDAHTSDHFPGYNVSAAINIDLRHRQYGVLTAARCPIHDTVGLKTNRREMHIATRKSMLITTHPFEDGSELTAVNLHAINFVSAAVFVEEIERLRVALLQRTGALIVTGDFNTWSRKRMEYLEHFAAAVGLLPAAYLNGHHIKQRFSKPLDHLYYRDVTLLAAEAVDTGRVSDHNPILATFKR